MPVCVKSEGHFFLHGRVDTAVVRISFSLREVLSRLSQYCWPCISSFLTAITVSPPPFCKSIYFSRFLHIWLKLLVPLFLFLHLTILVHSLHFAWLSSIISSLVIVTTTDPPSPFNETCQLVLTQLCEVLLDKLKVPQLTKKNFQRFMEIAS